MECRSNITPPKPDQTNEGQLCFSMQMNRAADLSQQELRPQSRRLSVPFVSPRRRQPLNQTQISPGPVLRTSQSHTSMSAADELLDRPEATLALLNISEPATEPPAGPVFPTLEPYPWSEPPISPSEVPAGLTRVAIPHPDLRLVDFEAQRESQEYINMLLDREEPGKKKQQS